MVFKFRSFGINHICISQMHEEIFSVYSSDNTLRQGNKILKKDNLEDLVSRYIVPYAQSNLDHVTVLDFCGKYCSKTFTRKLRKQFGLGKY